MVYNVFEVVMKYSRILTVQDISCFGQCSITVALPIISACGVETCILPSAVLSTHTTGFHGFTCRDLTCDMPSIIEHWKKENIYFDCLYTGYLGSAEQIEYVKRIAQERLNEGGQVIVDPAMADNGVLYPAFDMSFVKEMRKLCQIADVVLPNITEACLLTDTPYKTEYDEEYIDLLILRLHDMGAKNVVLTGVGYQKDKTGVAVLENGEKYYYSHERLPHGCHGTGDVYSSAFVGAICHGKDCKQASRISADFTLECIKNTQSDPSHWYGVKFEECLRSLINMLAD